jgi:hypothetical protein
MDLLRLQGLGEALSLSSNMGSLGWFLGEK